MKNYVAIMAGGIGSRFWPASRGSLPKQFLDILGTGKSLLRMTFERFLRIVPAEQIYIVTNKDYVKLVQEQLPELKPEQILGEPSRNNTAPCIAYTALKLHDLEPEANMVVAPSDHIILDQDEFVQTTEQALGFAQHHHALITLGIEPTRPDTGYGYIRYERAPVSSDSSANRGIHNVLQFTEKPPLEQARAYLDSGDYLWNAGIFIWSIRSLIEAFQELAPELLDILQVENIYNTEKEKVFLLENYPKTPKTSIDYAIMEKAGNVYTIPSSFGWSDLGTWASLYAELPKDENGNAVLQGRLLAEETRNSLIRIPKDKLVVIKGLEDFIVVDEEDVLLIYPKSKEQEIKEVTKRVEKEWGNTYW
jgi:mannose-1-phosphate guanylyltransferase